MSQVTVIVPLKDRSRDTETFLQHCLDSDLDYLFLDGSVGDENCNLIKPYANGHVRYERFAPDTSIDAYVSKMAAGLDLVTTPFAVMADNDDILIPNGIISASKLLQNDSESAFSGGDIIGMLRSLRHENLVSWPKTNVRTKILDGGVGLDAINRNRADWRHVWYSVFRTEVLKEAWSTVKDSSIRDPYLIEFFICDLAFVAGRYSYSSQPHYMRLQNQSDRAIASLGFRSVEFGRQAQSWWTEAHALDRHLAGLLGVDVDDIVPVFHRAAAVAGMATQSLRPKNLVPELCVRVVDRMQFLTINQARNLVEQGRHRCVPIRDRSGR